MSSGCSGRPPDWRIIDRSSIGVGRSRRRHVFGLVKVILRAANHDLGVFDVGNQSPSSPETGSLPRYSGTQSSGRLLDTRLLEHPRLDPCLQSVNAPCSSQSHFSPSERLTRRFCAKGMKLTVIIRVCSKGTRGRGPHAPTLLLQRRALQPAVHSDQPDGGRRRRTDSTRRYELCSG